jgi:hypothetical protein
MSDSTPRQALGVLADGQELDAMQINDALIQFDAMTDICLLGQFVNTPPASPADGDMYLLGAAPSGGWTGRAYKIAYCIDGGWRFYAPFNGLRAYVAATHGFLVYMDGAWTDANALIGANEVSIASASACDLGAAGSLFVAITGSATITSFCSGASLMRFVRFAGALTLTHNAAGLILLGGANRITAAGDVGFYRSDASGNWRELSYVRAGMDAGDAATRTGTETLTHKTLSGAVLSGTTTLPAGGALNSDGTTAFTNTLSVTGTSFPTLYPVRDAGSANTNTWGNFKTSVRSSASSGVDGFGTFISLAMKLSGGENELCRMAGVRWGADNSGAFEIHTANGGAMNARLRIDPSGHALPAADNAQTLGGSANRWSTVYAGTGAINTSGAQTKTGTRALDAAELAVARALAANVRLYRFRDAAAAKGEEARLHAGMIHEDVVAAFAAQGLDALRYGIVCRDAAPDGGWVLGLRYDELAQFVMAGLAARLDALEAAHDAG